MLYFIMAFKRYIIILIDPFSADQNIRWSYPVKIDESKHVVMNIPLYGDVKLTINTKSKISEVTFDYISEVRTVYINIQFVLYLYLCFL